MTHPSHPERNSIIMSATSKGTAIEGQGKREVWSLGGAFLGPGCCFEDAIRRRRQKERHRSHDHRGAMGVKSGRKDRRKQRQMSRYLELRRSTITAGALPLRGWRSPQPPRLIGYSAPLPLCVNY